MRFERPLVFDGPVLESVSIQIDHTKLVRWHRFCTAVSDAVQQQITENVRSSLQALFRERKTALKTAENSR